MLSQRKIRAGWVDGSICHRCGEYEPRTLRRVRGVIVCLNCATPRHPSGHCERCGKWAALEVHHLDGRLHGVPRSDNTVSICLNCHAMNHPEGR